MRRIFVILLLCVFPLSVSAQNDSVIVVAKPSLTGFWRIKIRDTPDNTGKGQLCRIAQTDDDLSMRCLPPSGKVSGSVDGNRIHLSLPGTICFNANCVTLPSIWLTLDATLAGGASFRGTTGVKLIGLTMFVPKEAEIPVPASGYKFDTAADAPDTPGKAPLLAAILGELTKGPIAHAHDAAMVSNMTRVDLANPNTTKEIRSLGDVLRITYVGEGQTQRGKWLPATKTWSEPPFSFNTYAVEFTNGQRLCGIHQRDDGVLDGFLCV
jgi:hypothetical protein